MKRGLWITAIVLFGMTLVGCDQAQKALDTIDKAKSFKGDVEKKAKDAADRAKGLIPGGDKEAKDDEQTAKEGGSEKDD